MLNAKSIFKLSLVAISAAILSSYGSVSAQTLYGSAGSQDQRENAINADWAYNWGIEPNHDVNKANFEFVPMIWSATPTGVLGQIDRIFALEADHGVHVDYVLGFNEPDLPTQANMTVQQGLDTWDVITNNFEDTDIELVSPAVTGGTNSQPLSSWLYPFMDEVELRNADADPENDLQIDKIAYHFYTAGRNAQTEANKLLANIDEIWNKYQRPVWLTEFAGQTFSENGHTLEERLAFNEAFLEILIPEFDSRPYLERVAWWQFGGFGKPISQLSSSSGGVFTPTGIGEIYARTTLESGESYDFAAGATAPTDVHYLKGGDLTNSGPALATALRAVDALEGDSSIGGTADFGFEEAEDAFVRVRSGATLRKQGTNSVSLKGAWVDNNGTFRVESGNLSLQNGTQVNGPGNFYVGGGGTLEFGAPSDTSGSKVDQALELDGGDVQMNPLATSGAHVIAGPTVLNATTTFSGDGNLTVTGAISSSGGLTKSGNGTMYLANANAYSGPTSIQGGKVLVANASGSATGSGPVQVLSGGTLGGHGTTGGLVIAQGGSTVAPGISESNLGITSLPAINEGVVVDALDFDFTGVQDDAPLTQTSTLSDALQLVSGLDFGAGIFPRNAVNDGNEFNVAGFSTGTTWGAAEGSNDYLTFTVAPVAGLAMQLEDVTFELRRNGSGAATHYRIFTSIDGFDVWNAGLSPLTFALDESNTTTQTFTAAYTGGESVTEPVEVRLYGWHANSDFGNTHFYNVSLDASFISDPDHIELDPTGILEIGGNYTQLDFATLAIEIGGTTSDAFDQLVVAGDVMLDGILDLSFIDDFLPQIGDTFDILTANSIAGTFDTINMPSGMSLGVNYLGSTVQVEVLAALPGDFDADGDVDGSDFLAWQRGLGTSYDASDLADWQSSYNNAGNIAASSAVPEPTGTVLVAIGIALSSFSKRNR